jgi:hypothetical protein
MYTLAGVGVIIYEEISPKKYNEVPNLIVSGAKGAGSNSILLL